MVDFPMPGGPLSRAARAPGFSFANAGLRRPSFGPRWHDSHSSSHFPSFLAVSPHPTRSFNDFGRCRSDHSAFAACCASCSVRSAVSPAANATFFGGAFAASVFAAFADAFAETTAFFAAVSRAFTTDDGNFVAPHVSERTRSSNAASPSTTVTSFSAAVLYLLPVFESRPSSSFLPMTRKVVLPETALATLPPRSRTTSWAASRDIVSRTPVNAKEHPCSGSAAAGVAGGFGGALGGAFFGEGMGAPEKYEETSISARTAGSNLADFTTGTRSGSASSDSDSSEVFVRSMPSTSLMAPSAGRFFAGDGAFIGDGAAAGAGAFIGAFFGDGTTGAFFAGASSSSMSMASVDEPPAVLFADGASKCFDASAGRFSTLVLAGDALAAGGALALALAGDAFASPGALTFPSPAALGLASPAAFAPPAPPLAAPKNLRMSMPKARGPRGGGMRARGRGRSSRLDGV
mmetsp:Transcript_507/g.1815  ORF Transcript_507/g.1815 Transcript_507/m.1815 type:complete len:462 (+) Transcript_507:1633-3018(+)